MTFTKHLFSYRKKYKATLYEEVFLLFCDLFVSIKSHPERYTHAKLEISTQY